ncbi:MAG: hypothetical protein CL680_17615 [Blastomonas sp.]|nr:hypothetical protein [Blastomonas sp.]
MIMMAFESRILTESTFFAASRVFYFYERKHLGVLFSLPEARLPHPKLASCSGVLHVVRSLRLFRPMIVGIRMQAHNL